MSKGDITQEVTANGALSPVKNVEVGSQVSGIIEKIYVDFNSRVKEGDMLVKIDPSTFDQALRQSEAELDNAQASLELAQVNYRRAKELFKNNLISASEHDTTLATLHQAEANVKIRDRLCGTRQGGCFSHKDNRADRRRGHFAECRRGANGGCQFQYAEAVRHRKRFDQDAD